MWEEYGYLVKLVIGTIIGLALIVFGVQGCNLNLINNVPVTATVDGKVVYQGSSGCVSVSSGGRTTTVTILGGFLCMFPQKEYVSENVHIEGVK